MQINDLLFDFILREIERRGGLEKIVRFKKLKDLDVDFQNSLAFLWRIGKLLCTSFPRSIVRHSHRIHFMIAFFQVFFSKLFFL